MQPHHAMRIDEYVAAKSELMQTILEYDPTQMDLLNYKALPGDANGDGTVDGQDFIIWNANKFTGGTDWITGDFNGDGVTDGQDFIIWNANKFTSVPLGIVTVPEPGMALSGVLSLMLLGCWRRTRR